MNHLTLLAITFVLILVVASTGFEYWQNRKTGLSHESSVHDASVACGFFSGSAALSYLITMLA
jgi:predicted negative regulator of RcsB-dependent stress response